MSDQFVNIRPDGFSEGGGLIDDVDATLSDIRFVMTDYDGVMTEQVPVARVMFDVEGEETEVLYSVGGSGDFAPDETGRRLTKLKSKDTLTKTSKFSMLLNSLVEAGFPLNKMDNSDIGYLIGLNGHFLRKVVTYAGLKRKKDDRDSTVLLCTKINKLPWENEKGKAKGKGKGREVDAGLADVVAGIIQGIIIGNDGEMAKKNLLSAMFKNEDVTGREDKKEVLKLASSDDFLKGREEWVYEDGVLKMA